MDRYESLGLVGEGSYGTVLKCRHRDSGRLVAIKKFMDSDDDKTVKKIAQREIKLLRQLHHDNLVNLLEVWRRRRRWYLVFEFVERTLLDDLEQNPKGIDPETSRQCLFQILRATAFCHQQNIIHRDIKPENILISQAGVVKLCDFGFARTVENPAGGCVYTDYVATRWYRAPELLVGDTMYGKPVDVWAIGCLLVEMLTGQPLFPGDSDLDQIYHIVKCFGNLTDHHQQLFYRNPVFSGVRLPECSDRITLQQRYPTVAHTALHLTQCCLQMDPQTRAPCSDLLEHVFFTHDSFHLRFQGELKARVQRDRKVSSTLPKISKSPGREAEERNQGGREKRAEENLEEKILRVKKRRQREETMERTANSKSNDTSKPPRSIRQPSEPQQATKQTKALGAKLQKSTVKASTKIKPGRAYSRDTKKEADTSKTAKPRVSEGSKTGTGLKNNNMEGIAPKLAKDASVEPQEEHVKNIELQDGKSPPIPTPHTSAPQASTITSLNNQSTTAGEQRVKNEEPKDLAPNALLNSAAEPSGALTGFANNRSDASDHSKAELILEVQQAPIRSLKDIQEDTPTHSNIRQGTIQEPAPTESLSDHTQVSTAKRVPGDPSISQPKLSRASVWEKLTHPSSSVSINSTAKEHSLDLKCSTSMEESHNIQSQTAEVKSASGPEGTREEPQSSQTEITQEPEGNHSAGASTDAGQPGDASRTTIATLGKQTSKLPLSTGSIHPHDNVSSPTIPPPPCSTPLSNPPSTTGPGPPPRLLGYEVQPESFPNLVGDKPKWRVGGSSHNRPTLQALPAASITAQRNSFLSDNGCHGNQGTSSTTKRLTDVHFPELRSTTLPELRERDGKQNKVVAKDQRKQSFPHSEQQRGPDDSQTHTP